MRIDIDALRNIIGGKVYYEGKWVPADIKFANVQRRRRLINEGYVEHNGKWITIDEKISAEKMNQIKNAKPEVENKFSQKFYS